MELLNAIILLLGTALPLAGAAITFIAKFIKSAKGKKAAESLIEMTNDIEQLMVKAEKLVGYTGQQKKDYVLRCAKNYALSSGMEFDEINAGKIIENLINFSKDVNRETVYLEPITKKTKAVKKGVSREVNDIDKKTLENSELSESRSELQNG